jgi:Family of unknown function (DUF5343)
MTQVPFVRFGIRGEAAMTAYPYVASPDKVSVLFKKIGEIGVPQKFTNAILKSVGLTSSNDQRLIGLVKFLGFADQSGVPTSLWREYRKQPRAAMAAAVRTAYSELFQHYPDANERDSEALRTYSQPAVAWAQKP